jgi:hypothetical protein
MEPTAAKSAIPDVCARCMQPVPEGATRCPRCATPFKNNRRITLWLGSAIGLAVVFVILLMVYAIRQDEFMNLPPEGDDSAPAASTKPAQPDKPPPLNQ